MNGKCTCGKCGSRICCRKIRPPRFLSFKVGDRVVYCPHKTQCGMRGRTGTIYSVYNHLEVVAHLDSDVSPFKQTEKCEVCNVKTYMLRHTSECHSCINRLTHMSGGFCPNGHKDIVFYEKEEEGETTIGEATL